LFKIIDYDRTRNTNREALAKLKKEPLNSQKNVWVNLGDFFVKLEKDNVKTYIEKGKNFFMTFFYNSFITA
jgi:hypothetical protein